VWQRGIHALLRENRFDYVICMELDLCHFPYNPLPPSEFFWKGLWLRSIIC
jgi:hypothetical protein